VINKAPAQAIYYGWFIVAASFFISLVTVGARNGFGVFVIPMSDDFGWNRGSISLAASVGFLLNGLSQPFVGRLYDKVGGRKLMLWGLLILGLGNVLLAFTTHLVFLILVFGVAMSIAMSAGSMNTTATILARWFKRKRSTAVAISAAGAPMGGLLLVPLTAYLITLTDWRFTWAVLGLLILCLALPLAYIFMRDNPQEYGLQPDGDASTPSNGQPRSQTTPASLESDRWRDAFHHPPVWQLGGAYFVCGFTTAIISAHFVPYAQERGFSPSLAATAFGVMSGLNFLGVMAAGALGDRFGRKNLLGLVYAMRGVGYASLLLIPDPWGLWGFALIAGFSWIATVPLTTSLTADFYGLRNLGILTGLIFSAHQIGSAISIQMGGTLRDITGSYDLPFAIAGLFLIGASILSFSIQERKYSSRSRRAQPQPIAPGV